jgi:hypothetical protein
VIEGDTAALVLKICVKNITKFNSRHGAASKMFHDCGANTTSSHAIFSFFEANTSQGP